jgi:hypothetical protein
MGSSKNRVEKQNKASKQTERETRCTRDPGPKYIPESAKIKKAKKPI